MRVKYILIMVITIAIIILFVDYHHNNTTVKLSDYDIQSQSFESTVMTLTESAQGKLLVYNKDPILFSRDELKDYIESGEYGICPHSLYSSESDIAPHVPIPIRDFCRGSSTSYFPGNIGYVNHLVGHGFHIDDAIKADINAYRFNYTSPGVDGKMRELSAAMFMPRDSSVKIKGIILYFHGTEAVKNSIPSCFSHDVSTLPSYCNGVIDNKYADVLGGVFASQGYIVIAPDYIGYGMDNKIIHPYVLYPIVNVQSGLNAIIAANSILNTLNFVSVHKNHRLYITGYSEGGGYALWASKLMQTDLLKQLNNIKLNLTMTTASEGAYDLVHAQVPFELSDLKDGVFHGDYQSDNDYNIVNSLTATMAKPLLSALLFTSYAYYDKQDYTRVMNPDFYNMSCGHNCEIDNLGHQTLLQLFSSNAKEITPGNIFKIVYASVLRLKNPTNQIVYDPIISHKSIRFNVLGIMPLNVTLKDKHLGQNNSIKAFINPEFIKSKDFQQVLANSSIDNFKTKSKIDLVSLSYDSVVTSRNSDNTYHNLDSQSPELVEYTVIPNAPLTKDMVKMLINNKIWAYDPQLISFPVPIDHAQGYIFAMFAALRDFNANR